MKRSYILPTVVILLCVMFILILLLTGKTIPSDIQTISDLQEKDELRFTSSWAGYDTNALPLKDILDRYRLKKDQIVLVDESMAGEDFLFTLKTDFATGNDPDVFGLWPGSDFELLVEQGRVADLTDLLMDDPEWYDTFYSDAWKYVTVDDRIYGVPFEIIFEALFINVDMFEANDIKVPTTYDELLTAVSAFREKDIVPIAFNTTPEGSFLYQNIVMKLGGREAVENPFDEEGELKDCFVEGMALVKDLYDLGAFPEDAFYMDDKTRNDMFMNKEAAMIVQGSWFIGEQGVDPNDETVQVIPFPAIEGGLASGDDIIYGCGNGIFHISQKAWENPLIKIYCIDLLKELTSVESAIRFQSSGGFISNIIIPDDMQESTHLYAQGEALIENATELVGPTDSFIDRVIWEDVLIDSFSDLLQGEMTASQIAELVSQEMEGNMP